MIKKLIKDLKVAFFIAFALLIVAVIYGEVIKPKQLLDKVQKDFGTTVQGLGMPSSYFYTKADCQGLQFITCQEMDAQKTETIYIWHRGLDMNIVAGFDKDEKLTFKKTIINEQTSIVE